jgi:hypothetical protein
MSKNISRRILLETAAASVFAASIDSVASRSMAQQKMSKSDAKYQDKPQGNQRCDLCRFFQAPNQCQVVQGDISPSGWCTLFAAKNA